MRIVIAGQVSCGKSSFINAICGDVVAKSSLLRETINTEEYSLQSIFLDDYVLVDTPGINDSSDSSDDFFRVLVEEIRKCNVVIYITCSESAFNLTSELTMFNKIKDEIKAKNDEGYYCELLVVANKYDYPDDEVDNLIGAAEKKIGQKIYRICSHKMFLYHKEILGDDLSEFRKISQRYTNYNDFDQDDLLCDLAYLDIIKKENDLLLESIKKNLFVNYNKFTELVDACNFQLYPILVENMKIIKINDLKYLFYLEDLDDSWLSIEIENDLIRLINQIKYNLPVNYNNLRANLIERYSVEVAHHTLQSFDSEIPFFLDMLSNFKVVKPKYLSTYSYSYPRAVIIRYLIEKYPSPFLENERTLVRMSDTPVEILRRTNDVYSGCFEKCFVHYPDLYDVFLRNIYSLPQGVLGDNLFIGEDKSILFNF